MGSPNRYTSQAAETFSLVTGSTAQTYPVILTGLMADNYASSPAAMWVQVFDGYAQPSGGAIPLLSIRTVPNNQVSYDGDFLQNTKCNKGIVVVLSSTALTYTAVNSSLGITAFWTSA